MISRTWTIQKMNVWFNQRIGKVIWPLYTDSSDDVSSVSPSLWGSRDSAVVAEVRALASHQCGPGSISRLLVLVLAPRGFSPGTPVFLSPQNTSKFQFDVESVPNWYSALNTLTFK